MFWGSNTRWAVENAKKRGSEGPSSPLWGGVPGGPRGAGWGLPAGLEPVLRALGGKPIQNVMVPPTFGAGISQDLPSGGGLGPKPGAISEANNHAGHLKTGISGPKMGPGGGPGDPPKPAESGHYGSQPQNTGFGDFSNFREVHVFVMKMGKTVKIGGGAKTRVFGELRAGGLAGGVQGPV